MFRIVFRFFVCVMRGCGVFIEREDIRELLSFGGRL